MRPTAAVHAISPGVVLCRVQAGRRSARRIPVPRAFFLLLLLGTSVGMTRSEPVLRAQSEARSRIVATPVALDPDSGPQNSRRGVGALRYVAGYALTSADPRFGGISAMTLTPRGFLALSDGGTVMWITAKPVTNRAGMRRPGALRLLPLPAGPGDSAVKADRDSEAIATDARGRIWVAYERHNSLWRYTPGFGRAEANRAPPEMARWRPNSGAEAMARLPDGRFLLFSEGAGRARDTSDVLIFDRDPVDPSAKGVRAGYRLPAGFSVTDAALLGDEQLMTLHRSFSISDGVAASIGIVDLAAFKPGAVVTPRIAATLRPPLTVDNMEALAIERVGRRTYIWIASDDNFSALQRTLLLQFELVER